MNQNETTEKLNNGFGLLWQFENAAGAATPSKEKLIMAIEFFEKKYQIPAGVVMANPETINAIGGAVLVWPIFENGEYTGTDKTVAIVPDPQVLQQCIWIGTRRPQNNELDYFKE